MSRIVYFLIALYTMTLVVAIYFYTDSTKKVDPVEKITYVKKPLTTADLEDRLLAFGVSSAWKETFGSNIKANCFQTELINGQAVVTFCKLKEKLTK